jgi:uncharacterized protein YndB with AHSA1/START domain
MVTVVRSHQILVNFPLQTVFDYVSDLTRHPEWSGGRLKIEAVTAGPIAIGKEYLSHGDVARQKDRPNRVQVTQYESPQRFAFVATDPDFGKVSHEFSFIEQNGEVLIVHHSFPLPEERSLHLSGHNMRIPRSLRTVTTRSL